MPLDTNTLFFGLRKKMTEEQEIYVNSMIDKQMTICSAKSGSGKTTLAVAVAKLLQKDLIYIFSPTSEGIMGFRPGTQEEKELEYVQPVKDALLEINEDPARVIYSEHNIDNIKNGNVWVYPKSHIFARGINIKGNDKMVVIDEAQNFTRGELKKILSRIHDDVRVVMIGHEKQCDLKDIHKSGFMPYLRHFKNEPYVNVCELTKNFRGRLSQKADELDW